MIKYYEEDSMQWKSALRMSMVSIPVIAVCGLLLAASSVGPTARADSQDTIACTDRTLQGDYASQIEGTILGPNLPLRGLAMAHFDGKGNITQVDHIVVNGVPPAVEWSPGTGTYSVNPDCTGSAVINSSSAQGPINLHFVVVNHGKQINQVVDANAVTAVAYRVE
jgi:hypothetical protein